MPCFSKYKPNSVSTTLGKNTTLVIKYDKTNLVEITLRAGINDQLCLKANKTEQIGRGQIEISSISGIGHGIKVKAIINSEQIWKGDITLQ